MARLAGVISVAGLMCGDGGQDWCEGWPARTEAELLRELARRD